MFWTLLPNSKSRMWRSRRLYATRPKPVATAVRACEEAFARCMLRCRHNVSLPTLGRSSGPCRPVPPWCTLGQTEEELCVPPVDQQCRDEEAVLVPAHTCSGRCQLAKIRKSASGVRRFPSASQARANERQCGAATAPVGSAAPNCGRMMAQNRRRGFLASTEATSRSMFASIAPSENCRQALS